MSPAEARGLQRKLAGRVELVDEVGEPRTVGGADVHYGRASGSARGAVCVLRYPALELGGTVTAICETPFPYRPGLLSFREAPLILEALERLPEPPDVLLCDGHGYAHPRRFGLASHVGIAGGLPTVGVAKSLLVGRHADLPPERGAWRPVRDGQEVVGAAVRTRAGVRPVYVSVGHRVSLGTAVRRVLACAPRFRIPEPLRRADRAARGTAETEP